MSRERHLPRVSYPRNNNGTLFVVRRAFALLAAGAFVSCIGVYFYSFDGLTLNAMGIWPVALHCGVFLLLIPMFWVERAGMRERTFFWYGFKVGKPTWVYSAVRILGLLAVAHFVLFMVQSHMAAPDIVNGQYVLNDHGQIKKLLTEGEYLRLKGSELRIFATGWVFFYFFSMAYWWFPRLKASGVINEY